MSDIPKESEALASKVAIQEILSPTWGVTEQFFAVHEPLIKNGLPQIARIDSTREKRKFYVYFAVKGEPYFFVIIIENRKESFEVAGAYSEAEVGVYLYVSSKSIDTSTITKRIGIQPTEVRKKGDPKPRVTGKYYDEHMWYFEPHKDIPDKLERKLVTLLDLLTPKAPQISALSKECYLCINIYSYEYSGYGQLLGLHLDNDILQKLASLGVEIDFDRYAWGPHLTE